VAVVLVGSLLGALLSPSCGPNSWTLLNFVSIIAAIVAGVVLSGLVMGFYHRHRGHGHVSYRLKALPTGLLVAATCVALSRATGFRPGYLYGAVAAISYSRALTKPEEGHAAAVGALTTLLAGLAAWAAWDSLYQTSSPPGASFGSVLAADFFAAYFVSAVVGTVVSLFPLRFLPGYMLRSWSARAWGVTFGVALFVLLQFLLRPTSGPGGRSDAPLVTTLVLLVLASAGSVVFRDHFARRRRHEAGHGKADPTSPEQAGPEHGGLDPTSPEQAGPEHGGLEQTSPEQAGPEHGGLEQTSPEQVAPQGAIG
jgi:hypothetical protein